MKKINTPELRWAILCTGTSIDQASNNITLFSLVEQLNVNRKALDHLTLGQGGNKLLPVKFDLATLWGRGGSEKPQRFEAEFSFVGPDGRVISKTAHKIEIPAGIERTRFVIAINALGIADEGTYRFHIGARAGVRGSFRQIGGIPLEVTFRE